MLPVLIKRRTLKTRLFSAGYPEGAGFRYRDAVAIGDMGAFTHLYVRCRRECICFLLSLERLEFAGAILFDIVNNPGCPLLTFRGFPSALTYRHRAPQCVPIRHVAPNPVFVSMRLARPACNWQTPPFNAIRTVSQRFESRSL